MAQGDRSGDKEGSGGEAVTFLLICYALWAIGNAQERGEEREEAEAREFARSVKPSTEGLTEDELNVLEGGPVK